MEKLLKALASILGIMIYVACYGFILQVIRKRKEK